MRPLRRGRQADNKKSASLARFLTWRLIVFALLRRRRVSRGYAATALIYDAAKHYVFAKIDYALHVRRTRTISYTNFVATYDHLSDHGCSSLFPFCKSHVAILSTMFFGEQADMVSRRNRYSTTTILSTCIILRRLAKPFGWRDVECFFGKHSSQLSKLFWEVLDDILDTYSYLLTAPLPHGFIETHAERYASAVHQKTGALNNCIGFIDGTVLKVVRPTNNGLQNVVYNGHKRAHTLKMQAVTAPDGMFLHVSGPLEGWRHDWTLYVRTGLDEQLSEGMVVNGKQYCVFGDSGYNWRDFIEIPFQGSNLSDDQGAYNKAMFTGRVTVEWMFK